MEKITLNEYLKQGSVVENLKNFVGVTPENTVGLMTPERLAAVAGGLAFPMIHKFRLTIKPNEEVALPIDYGLLIAFCVGNSNFAIVTSVNYLTKNTLVEHKLSVEKTKEFFTTIKYNDSRYDYEANLDCIFIGTYCKVVGA